jgi:hypothetical protein
VCIVVRLDLFARKARLTRDKRHGDNPLIQCIHRVRTKNKITENTREEGHKNYQGTSFMGITLQKRLGVIRVFNDSTIYERHNSTTVSMNINKSMYCTSPSAVCQLTTTYERHNTPLIVRI